MTTLIKETGNFVWNNARLENVTFSYIIWQIAQRRCEVCGGSGLVLREKDYFKCPECGMIQFLFFLYIYIYIFFFFSAFVELALMSKSVFSGRWISPMAVVETILFWLNFTNIVVFNNIYDSDHMYVYKC